MPISFQYCRFFVEPILERVDGWSIHDWLWKTIPIVDRPLTEKLLSESESTSGDIQSSLGAFIVTRTAVARLPLRQLCFLVQVVACWSKFLLSTVGYLIFMPSFGLNTVELPTMNFGCMKPQWPLRRMLETVSSYFEPFWRGSRVWWTRGVDKQRDGRA